MSNPLIRPPGSVRDARRTAIDHGLQPGRFTRHGQFFDHPQRTDVRILVPTHGTFDYRFWQNWAAQLRRILAS